MTEPETTVHRESSALRARIVGLIAQRDVVKTVLADLEAIVDKLPKCWRLDESGKLVQDVPVVPGMTLHCLGDNRQISAVVVSGVFALQECSMFQAREGGNLVLWPYEDAYSTREAAEVAREEAAS